MAKSDSTKPAISKLKKSELTAYARKLEAENQALKEDIQNQVDFFVGMSHEIRTPLTAVLGYAESLLDPDMKLNDRLEAIKTIIGSGHHLLALINNLLDISKSESGKLDVELNECHLIELVTEVVHMFSKQCEDKGLELKTQFNSVVPKVIFTDSTRVKSILINLIGNAIKFTPTGQIQLVVYFDEQEGQVHFAVSDTGIGMTAKEVQSLFGKYQQANNRTRFNFGGTGLGLYLCKRFATELGGNISVLSSHGTGSTFEFFVPCNLSNPELVEGGLTTTNTNNANVPPRLIGSVLIAEDVAANQQLFSMYIRRTGATVDIAANGQEAVEKTQNNRYSLILMDMQMPIMDGVTATLKIREFDPATPILGLSANARKQEIDELLAAGCNDYLVKPIQRHAFFRILETYLKHGEDSLDDDSPLISQLADENLPNFDELVDLFITDLRAVMTDMQEAMQAQDWQTLRTAAHRLKGSGGGFGYPSLTEMAGQLEFQILSKNEENIRRYYDIVLKICHRIIRGADAKS